MKPGIQTTEFWLTAVVNLAAPIIALLVVRQVISAEEAELWLQLVTAAAGIAVPLVAMMYTTRVYTQARSDLKKYESA